MFPELLGSWVGRDENSILLPQKTEHFTLVALQQQHQHRRQQQQHQFAILLFQESKNISG